MKQDHFFRAEEHVEDPVRTDPHLPEFSFDLPEGDASGSETPLYDLGQCRRNGGLVGT
jgi:hypothetical protein